MMTMTMLLFHLKSASSSLLAHWSLLLPALVVAVVALVVPVVLVVVPVPVKAAVVVVGVEGAESQE